jgi:nitroimidazol reductase NimA-like FMN-containing flavoprotein (pyridoxamine 5'-phosphate oxidase superfamily)
VILDRCELEVLDWDACFALAGTQPIGRLGVTNDALPIIMPVAFALLDRTPVFQVASGAVRRAATQAWCPASRSTPRTSVGRGHGA